MNLQPFLNTISANSVLFIAYSGGVDSHVLLHSLIPFKKQFQLKAVHVHHGLMPNADDWSGHCQHICTDLQMECEVIRVHVKPKKGESIEACARKARYDAFATLMKESKSTPFLLTAHHLDDQAETCLLQFFRGSGFRGLASMPEITEFANGFLARPFLHIFRHEILDEAKKNNLKWIEDESNHDTRFSRNFIRYELMPILEKRYPSITKSIMRVAEHSAETDQLLQELAALDMGLSPAGDCPLSPAGDCPLFLLHLKKLSIPRQKNVIRYWLLKQGFLMPSQVKLDHIISDVIHSREDANPIVHWENVEIRKYQNTLYAMKPLLPHDPTKIYEWDGKSDLIIPNIGTLFTSSFRDIGSGPVQARSTGSRIITIRFRQGGETIVINGKKKSLKNYFQEQKIPPWQRDRIPLIYIENELIGIVKKL